MRLDGTKMLHASYNRLFGNSHHRQRRDHGLHCLDFRGRFRHPGIQPIRQLDLCAFERTQRHGHFNTDGAGHIDNPRAEFIR